MKRLYYEYVFWHMKQHDQMLFLMGPRQVGKTTLAKDLLEEWKLGIYLSWDNLNHRKLILEGADAVVREAGLDEFQESPPLIIFDEIQKYKRWKTYLKGFYDTYHGEVKIIVTGSSKLDVFVKGGDSLMGRYFILRIHPLTIAEVVGNYEEQATKKYVSQPKQISQKKFQNMQRFGGFPDPFLKADKAFYQRWKTMRSKQIFKEDIRDLTRVQEISGIETLASLMVEQIGQLVSYTSFSKKIGMISDKTVKQWIQVLKSLYFFFEIRPYSRNVSKSLIKQPKYYLWDWSLAPNEGALAENFVASHLLKSVHFWNDIGLGDYDLYFLRDLQGREVNFLITKEKRPWILVEVKHGEGKFISKHLSYFHDLLGTDFAFEVSLEKEGIQKNCFLARKPAIVPATSFLSQLF